LDKTHAKTLQNYLEQRGIIIGGGETIRLVTHLDVTADDIRTVIMAVKDLFSEIKAT
jgi:threonine aldolase